MPLNYLLNADYYKLRVFLNFSLASKIAFIC